MISDWHQLWSELCLLVVPVSGARGCHCHIIAKDPLPLPWHALARVSDAILLIAIKREWRKSDVGVGDAGARVQGWEAPLHCKYSKYPFGKMVYLQRWSRFQPGDRDFCSGARMKPLGKSSFRIGKMVISRERLKREGGRGGEGGFASYGEPKGGGQKPCLNQI